jgi:ankyrin repeat protein
MGNTFGQEVSLDDSIDYIKFHLKTNNINEARETGTLLHSAVRKKNYHIVDYLINTGIDQTLKNAEGKIAYEYAEYNMKRFIDYLNKKPCTKWMHINNDKFIDDMLANGADINVKDDDGWTLLHYAEDPARSKLYIDKGANIEARDKDGRTPFNLTGNDKDMWKFLAESGADINSKNNNDRTCVECCRSIEDVVFLISLGCEPTKYVIDKFEAKKLVELLMKYEINDVIKTQIIKITKLI